MDINIVWLVNMCMQNEWYVFCKMWISHNAIIKQGTTHVVSSSLVPSLKGQMCCFVLCNLLHHVNG
jgi:hypothetical protein